VSLFFTKEVSQLQTSDINLDWDSKDLNTLLLGKQRIVNEIEVIINTPKATIFKAREIGSQLHTYVFAPYEEDVPNRISSGLAADLQSGISGVDITKVDVQADPMTKQVSLAITLKISDATYVLPVAVGSRT
jgi:phage baseplate assembly protein W